MRRQVPDRLLVAGLSFVIREKRRVGLFFFLPSLSSVLWLKAVSWYRQTEVMGQTRTHKCMHWHTFDGPSLIPLSGVCQLVSEVLGVNADGPTVNPTQINRIWSSLFRRSQHWGWLSSGSPNYDYFMSVTYTHSHTQPIWCCMAMWSRSMQLWVLVTVKKASFWRGGGSGVLRRGRMWSGGGSKRSGR